MACDASDLLRDALTAPYDDITYLKVNSTAESMMSSFLREAAHRPWPMPRWPWLMRMDWEHVLFAHWPIEPSLLRRVLPAPLPIDTWEGRAYLAVVPLEMTNVRPRFAPPIPGLSRFPELNVRTYVTVGDKPGVYFFSLDAFQRLAVDAARTWFHLNYYYARMVIQRDGSRIIYSSSRRDDRGKFAEFAAEYRPRSGVFRSTPGSLEHWLTERYCLYAVDAEQRVIRGEIHHRQWPLQTAEWHCTSNSMSYANDIELPATPPLLHYARRIEVAGWAPHIVSSQELSAPLRSAPPPARSILTRTTTADQV